MEKGVEIVGFARNDKTTPHTSGHHYLAVWKMPSIEQVEALENAVAQAGWHDYFEQVNARGPLIAASEALADMAHLGAQD